MSIDWETSNGNANVADSDLWGPYLSAHALCRQSLISESTGISRNGGRGRGRGPRVDDFSCDYASFVCKAIIKFEALESHCDGCQFNPDALVACSRRCGASLKKRDIKSHSCINHLLSVNKSMMKEMEQTRVDRRLNPLGCVDIKVLEHLVRTEVDEKTKELRDAMAAQQDEIEMLKDMVWDLKEALLPLKDPRVFGARGLELDKLRLYVGNIPSDHAEEDLALVFANFGQITNVSIKTGNGKPPFYGFVTFKEPKSIDEIMDLKPFYHNGHRYNVERINR